MTTISLTTQINAPILEVFELSRDIDFHKTSVSDTQEEAIAGVTSGKIGMGETVRWRGKHFGVFLTHESKITAFHSPSLFTDEMISGRFKSFRHEHRFRESGNKTIMEDILTYETPYGIFGRLFDTFFLEKHLTTFLQQRNLNLKKALES
ncbi:cell division protein [Dokdonia sinensis]|uniref:Cell division protein n=1 Tax=Dokdonia sinensis TaxID=2479847 RepID=A0A3M0G7U0_9FLAO|nr:SRPBCC family protein [Dokdonia sinensis]RMB57089.1 cell division protein [Dokdonia sinensis]